MEEHGDQDADQVRRIERRDPEASGYERNDEEIALDVRPHRQLPQEHDHVHCDEQIVDDRRDSPRIVISERQHAAGIVVLPAEIPIEMIEGLPQRLGLRLHF